MNVGNLCTDCKYYGVIYDEDIVHCMFQFVHNIEFETLSIPDITSHVSSSV